MTRNIMAPSADGYLTEDVALIEGKYFNDQI